MRSDTGWGGARSGAGRPRQNLHISLDHAKMLAKITQRWRKQFPEIDENRMVELLITQQAISGDASNSRKGRDACNMTEEDERQFSSLLATAVLLRNAEDMGDAAWRERIWTVYAARHTAYYRDKVYDSTRMTYIHGERCTACGYLAKPAYLANGLCFMCRPRE